MMKKVLCIVAASILFCTLFVGAKSILMPALMDTANYGMERLKNSKQKNIVFVGSSMFRQAIDISKVDEESTYLLAYNGHQPFSEYLQMKEVIDSGVKIDTFVVDMYAYTLTAAPKLSDTRMLQDGSLKFALSMYEVIKQHGEADGGDLYELLVTSNNEMFITWPISFGIINGRYKNGGSSDGLQGSTREKLEKANNNLSNAGEIKSVQVHYVKKMIELCAEHGIKIVFLETPKYEYLYEESGYVDIMNSYMEILEGYDCEVIINDDTASRLKDDYRNKCLIYNFDESNPSFFADLIHLSLEGKRKFTEEMAFFFAS